MTDKNRNVSEDKDFIDRMEASKTAAPIQRTVQWSIQNDPNSWDVLPELVEVLRIEPNRIWVNPDVEVTEAAKGVLAALDSMLQHRYQEVWNEAIEAAAEVVGRVLREDRRWQADAIRELKK